MLVIAALTVSLVAACDTPTSRSGYSAPDRPFQNGTAQREKGDN